MKRLHREDLYCWSTFNEERNIDFHSYLWIREGGNVVIDPLSLSDHDQKHLDELGGVAWIVFSNSTHLRGGEELISQSKAKVVVPVAEKDAFTIQCDDTLKDGDEPFEGFKVFEFHGSKTPGELSFLLDETTLITSDLVRAHQGGRLMVLPPAKITDPQKAKVSVERLQALSTVEVVLPADGFQLFRGGSQALNDIDLSIYDNCPAQQGGATPGAC